MGTWASQSKQIMVNLELTKYMIIHKRNRSLCYRYFLIKFNAAYKISNSHVLMYEKDFVTCICACVVTYQNNENTIKIKYSANTNENYLQ